MCLCVFGRVITKHLLTGSLRKMLIHLSICLVYTWYDFSILLFYSCTYIFNYFLLLFLPGIGIHIQVVERNRNRRSSSYRQIRPLDYHFTPDSALESMFKKHALRRWHSFEKIMSSALWAMLRQGFPWTKKRNVYCKTVPLCAWESFDNIQMEECGSLTLTKDKILRFCS